MLQINDLSVRYKTSKTNALESINIEASKGEFIVIAGSSGSGKSTLAKVLMTLIPNFVEAEIKGDITFDGTSYRNLTREKLVSILGYVPQYPSDFTTSMLVEEEIVFLLENLALETEKILLKLNQVLEDLEISNLQKRVIPELSSGELQRVFLASAIAYAPPIIILDEPIARIDSATELKLVDLLRNLADKGHLIIAFEHRLDYILAKADRLIVLEKGKIVGDGKPSDYLEMLKEIDPPELSLLELEDQNGLFTLDDKIDLKKTVAKLKKSDCLESSILDNKENKEIAVSLKNIGFRYSNKSDLILKDIGLQLRKGESIGLMGINGSGKSTLMKIILGVEKAIEGEVWIKGTKIRSVRKGKKDCIFIPENAKLFLVGPTPLRDLERELKNKEQVVEIYRSLKLDHLMKRKLYFLSEGERRLFALINSFHFQDDIVLLDEPTIALDRRGREILLKYVETETNKGKTIILATNDPRIVTTLNRLVVIENGKICLDGPPREVLYQLADHSRLIPNQTVRLIQKLEEESGTVLPKIVDPREFNSLLKGDE